MYHCDHIGYVFNGLIAKKATSKEKIIIKEKEKKDEEQIRIKKIECLEQELEKLKNQ